jgi:hypothetical protein
MNPHQKPPVRVKVSLSLKAVQQDGKRWFDRWVTEIVQSGPALRFGAKRTTFKEPQPSTDMIAKLFPMCHPRTNTLRCGNL